MNNSVFISLRYTLIISFLGPIGLPIMFLFPLFLLIFNIGLGFIGIGLVIFFLTGGAFFFFPLVWLVWAVSMLDKLRSIFFLQRKNISHPLPVILTYILLLIAPVTLYWLGFIYESLYIFITTYAFAIVTLRKPKPEDLSSNLNPNPDENQ